MPLMNSATGFRAHRMLEVVVKGITLFSYSYDDAFLAIVDVIHDWGATIFIKDYDKGIISARDFGPNFNIPGKIFGFNLSKVSDTDTKIILKVTRKSYGIDTAAPEDVFDAIEKQILFRERAYQGNKKE
ncbi:MAG: hypothetical protein HZC18_03750 [Candidatus Omnitrophica bacterium]|nr:hypothetical protein [Candidatus Omnitrophota bacterium]